MGLYYLLSNTPFSTCICYMHLKYPRIFMSKKKIYEILSRLCIPLTNTSRSPTTFSFIFLRVVLLCRRLCSTPLTSLYLIFVAFQNLTFSCVCFVLTLCVCARRCSSAKTTTTTTTTTEYQEEDRKVVNKKYNKLVN